MIRVIGKLCSYSPAAKVVDEEGAFKSQYESDKSDEFHRRSIEIWDKIAEDLLAEWRSPAGPTDDALFKAFYDAVDHVTFHRYVLDDRERKELGYPPRGSES